MIVPFLHVFLFEEYERVMKVRSMLKRVQRIDWSPSDEGVILIMLYLFPNVI